MDIGQVPSIVLRVEMNLAFWNDVSTIIGNLLTGAGIVLGGLWTYRLFVRQRLRYPRVNTSLSVTDVFLDDGKRLVHAEIKVDNVGSVVFCSDYAELRIRQVIPIPEEFDAKIKDDEDPVEEGKSEVIWPLINEREWEWEGECFEIEPGEYDSLHADYVIPGNISVVEFYCFIANAKKKKLGVGWTITQMHKFNLFEEGRMAQKDTNQQGDRRIQEINEQQQRQQKQQQQQQKQKKKKKK